MAHLPHEFENRLERWRRELSARLRRSGRVFFLTLTVACGIEVLIDAHVTLDHINVARAALRQKGRDYVSILRRAARDAVEQGKESELADLVDPFFDDPEVAFVQFRNLGSTVLYEKLCPMYESWFTERHKRPFRDIYRKQMQRDMHEILTDPHGLMTRYHFSRHRDLFQKLTTLEHDLAESVFPSPPARATRERPALFYQDRIKDEHGDPDKYLTWAVGAVYGDDDEQKLGSVLIGFDTRRTTAQVREKLFQGLAVVAFFVGLIVVQGVLSRRSRLRLLELEAAEDAARRAIRAEIPDAAPVLPGYDLDVELVVGKRLGGATYTFAQLESGLELLLVLPEKGGVEGAVSAVALVELYREMVKAETVAERFAELITGYSHHALRRRCALVLLRVGDGRVEGISAGLRAPAIMGADLADASPTPASPLPLPPEQAELLSQPPRPFHAALPAGAGLLCVADCTPAHKGRVLHEWLVSALRASHRPLEIKTLAERLRARVTRHGLARRSDDLVLAVLVERATG